MSTEALRDAIAEVLVSRDIMRLTEPADWRNEVDAIMALPEIVALQKIKDAAEELRDFLVTPSALPMDLSTFKQTRGYLEQVVVAAVDEYNAVVNTPVRAVSHAIRAGAHYCGCDECKRHGGMINPVPGTHGRPDKVDHP